MKKKEMPSDEVLGGARRSLGLRAFGIQTLMGLSLVVSSCFLSTGCEDDGLQPIPPLDDQIDLFSQNVASRVDILWVVDNSESMLAEQAKVSSRFTQFFNQLLTSQVDYHLGVITTDPISNGVLRTYIGDAVPGCDSCRFLTKDVQCSNPGVVTVGLSDAEIDAALFSECQAQLVFRKLISAGVDGASFEEGFVQAARALGVHDIDPLTGAPLRNPPEGNVGFLREDASLYIIFVSDEDEGAKQDGSPVRYYERLFEGVKGAGNENKVSVSAITGWPLEEDVPVNAAGVCGVLSTTFDANSADNDPLAPAVIELLTSRSGCVDQSAGINDSNTFAETGSRYIELACRTGGVVTNMCEADYSSALEDLGANAAGLLRKFPLSKADYFLVGSYCFLFDEDVEETNNKLDCDDDGAKDGALDSVICVYATNLGTAEQVLVPHDAITGWTWEGSTNSVRFNGNFVPAPGSDVELRYKLMPESGSGNGCSVITVAP
ncbi:MAG: hypothetical protein GY822_28010 [Deltaproteobacteria bacterium]|nr:hypothetical protein [Deltaproteobacteria bacterium]